MSANEAQPAVFRLATPGYLQAAVRADWHKRHIPGVRKQLRRLLAKRRAW